MLSVEVFTMATDPEAIITLAASILLANQSHTADVEAQRGRIRTAVDTAKQVHTEVKRVLSVADAQAAQTARNQQQR